MIDIDELISKITVRELASKIDHTLLKPYATYSDLEKYIDDVKEYGFACLMIPSSLIPKAKEIAGNTIKLATVVGFPLGNCSTSTKIHEARLAIEYGAKEIDMVMNINFFKSRDYSKALEDMKRVVYESKKHGAEIVKVIIETGLLSDEEKIKATELVIESGADYVKTSTGFLAGGATIHDVKLLYNIGKGRIKVKAAGGIRHALDALAMIMAGASRIGTSTGDKIIKEFIVIKEK